ncbi:RluA family pseudouridine synthase [Candidatus Thioglobus sp.]|uniref:RluA family pseudouridine synthase n=1 Tax=Candidatus Thioglobus sp. TaxID=2026721 RepID=UPI002634D8FE|nr:RluA family pseudouridine synthase [Candidatus Thioglobus sp.]MDG2394726.1 RluA family pseudouridine synthase [Candidatus Thioglobus sp.]
MIERKITIKADNQLLIDALAESTSLSKQVLKSALDKGCVWLKVGKKTNRIRRVKKPLKIGNEVFIYFNEKILNSIPTQPSLLLDKKDYSVWFKPAGVFSQGSKWGDHCALTRLVEKLMDRNTFLVHRLDRATSGLMIIAHTKHMARCFSELFAERHIKKTYLAIVEKNFPHETISLNNNIDGKHALSHVTKLMHDKDKTLLKVHIETGRKHQIRKHLSDLGFPIIGDRLHGNAQKNHPENLQLQAVNLIFSCPMDQQLINIALSSEVQLKL